jgi:Zn-dependent protease/CBS domain-containing protein
MKWSWKLCRVAGIGVFLHWTFLVFIGWLVMFHLQAGNNLVAAIEGVGLVLAIFACVLLHEFGHALMARRFGIRTLDITLLPIGGIARLERLPENPKQELSVALAGPAVNIVIAGLLFVWLAVWDGVASHWPLDVHADFLTKLMVTNALLAAFNLLPAFPMDGGRVLRALLAHRLDYVRATQIATTVGQAMAIMFGVLGVFFNWFMLFIALFVYIGAEQESRLVQTQALLKDAPARDAMITRFRVLSRNATLSEAAKELLSGTQEDFPVVDDNDQVVGVLTRGQLVGALAEFGPRLRVSEAMRHDCITVDEEETLKNTFEIMREQGCSSLAVVRDGQLVGVVTLENIGDWIMVQSALDQGESPAGVEELLKV